MCQALLSAPFSWSGHISGKDQKQKGGGEKLLCAKCLQMRSDEVRNAEIGDVEEVRW